MDKLNTRQAADDRRPAVRGPRRPDLPRLHRASPLRTARLLARGVGPAQGLPAAGFSHEDATALCPALSTRPPGRTGRNRQGVSGCGREEATRGQCGGAAAYTGPPAALVLARRAGGHTAQRRAGGLPAYSPGRAVHPHYQPGDEGLEHHHPLSQARTPAPVPNPTERTGGE